MYEDKILEAVQLISMKHKDQKRKIFDYPYVSHLLMVYHMVTLHSDDENVHVAALLHDLVEDTEIELSDIEGQFGKTVAVYVGFLSEDKSLEWELKKQVYQEQLSRAPSEVLLIKSADLIYNLQDLIYILRNYSVEEYESMFLNSKKWLLSKQELINTLKDKWSENPLIEKVQVIFNELTDLHDEKIKNRS